MSERRLRFDRPPHLPPPSAAPILKNYNPDIRRVDNEARLEAPHDDRNVVDIFKTVELAMSLVDPDYKWPRETCDVHHFVWERAKYHPDRWGGDKIPLRYREIPFQKGYLPRQLHDFIHATIAPPPIPAYETMRQRVEDSESAKRLFEAARQVLVFHRQPSKIVRKTEDIDEEILFTVLTNMLDNFEQQRQNFPETNEFVESIRFHEMPLESMARELGRLAAQSSVNLLPKVYGSYRHRAPTAA